MTQPPIYSDVQIVDEVRRYFPEARAVTIHERAPRHYLYRAAIRLDSLDADITVTRTAAYLRDPPDTTTSDIGIADGEDIWWFRYKGADRSGFLHAIPETPMLASARPPASGPPRRHQHHVPAPTGKVSASDTAIMSELQRYFPSAQAIQIVDRDAPWCRYRAAVYLSELEQPFFVTHSPPGKREPPDLDGAFTCITDEGGSGLLVFHYSGRNDDYILSPIIDGLFVEIGQLPPR